MANADESATPTRATTRVTAKYLRGFQVQVVVDRGGSGKGYGPWSLIVDEGPNEGGDGLGPPPVAVAWAALAA